MKGFPLPISDRELTSILSHLADEDSFVFLETTRLAEDNYLSYLFLNPLEKITCKGTDDPAAFLETVQGYCDAGYYLAGSFSYEFGYLLEEVLRGLIKPAGQVVAAFGVYRKPFVYDHRRGDFVGGRPWPSGDGRRELADRDYRITDPVFSLTREDYLAKIARIKRYIEAGDTYQVNYTLKLLFDFEGSDISFYKTLRRNQSVSYGAFLKDGGQRTLSFSPELFFRKRGDECMVRPMKGTMHRAVDLAEDAEVRASLAADIKNRSENVMIVDLLRNDLGRLCVMGEVETVSLFDVETYETLHQMTSSIRGRLRPEVGVGELFRAIFPCGSVTGAPKIRTMEIISELEETPRGIYTGGIGFFSPAGDVVFNVPIRTVVLDENRGEMGIGSGIVYDSDPEKEWEECCLKGRFLRAVLPEFQLIETLLYRPQGGFWLLGRHLDRLEKSAAYWGFSFCREEAVSVLEQGVLSAATEECRRIRLLLHKDGGLAVETFACPDPFQVGDEGNGEPLPVVLSSSHTDSTDPFYYHKTTCRNLYDPERKRALAAGFYEVLYRNERGEMTEGGVTNLFVRKKGRLLTPPRACGLLGGVFRAALLAGEAKAPGGLSVAEEIIGLEALENAEEVYVGNSVRGLVRVRLVDGLDNKISRPSSK
ncbi:MAG: aminodeoxychorismate synthase component I [Desulfurivibrionaceae bacterium]|nr:aminodeoxychorismate synthase component I [Desulfurivibrionaceae bacterium]